MSDINDMINEIKSFVETSDIPIVVYKFLNGRVVTVLVSDGFISIQSKDMNREKVITQLDYDMYKNVHPDDVVRIVNDAKNFALHNVPYDVIYREKLYGKDEYSLLHATGYHKYFPDGSRYAIVIYDDVTKAVKENFKKDQLFDHSITEIINNTNEAIAIVDIDTHELIMANSTIRAILPPKKTFDAGITFEDYFFSEGSIPWISIEELIGTGENIIINPETKTELIVKAKKTMLEDREVYILYINLKDVKYHDSLTGLANMNYFLLRGENKVKEIISSGKKPVILYFDIRNMKKYNYKYGFQAGNELIKNVASVLKKEFPKSFVCRFSDDHFVILTGSDNYKQKISNIHHSMFNFGHGMSIEINAGVSFIDDKDTDLSISCDKARLACISIKNNLNKFIQLYEPVISKEQELHDYVTSNIDSAIRNDYIKVYYQPVIRTNTKEVCGFEALARWDDPVYGLLTPNIFIPALEESHQIHKLDTYIIDRICRDLNANIKNNQNIVPVSFNLSKLDFISCDIFSVVEKKLESYNIPCNMVNVEITESIMVGDNFINDVIKKFKDNGYEVWMDDFGSGYSSLNLLKDYDFDELKIDMDFLSSFTIKSKNIIKSTIEMAKLIGIRTLAEGVENPEHYEFLKDAGCEKVQGFLFGKPMPIDECTENCIKLGLTFEKDKSH